VLLCKDKGRDDCTCVEIFSGVNLKNPFKRWKKIERIPEKVNYIVSRVVTVRV